MLDWQFVDTIFVLWYQPPPPLVALLSKETFAESNELINSHITLECGRQINDAKNIFIHETSDESERAREEWHALGIFKHSTTNICANKYDFFSYILKMIEKMLAKVALEKWWRLILIFLYLVSWNFVN